MCSNGTFPDDRCHRCVKAIDLQHLLLTLLVNDEDSFDIDS